MLIINADDWGRDRETTDRILDCVVAGAVSSTSAMVYMEDSERAAKLAQKEQIDTGLHLNLTSAFTAGSCPSRLRDQQDRVAKYLRGHKFASVLFHPGLMSSFEYVVAAQLEEYQRLFGETPARIDGHHHMHHCANILFMKLLPAGTVTRRNFTFHAGEKSLLNRFYRQMLDNALASRHLLVDYLYSIIPLHPIERLTRIAKEAENCLVELETHPINVDEYKFLTGDEYLKISQIARIGSFRTAFAEVVSCN